MKNKFVIFSVNISIFVGFFLINLLALPNSTQGDVELMFITIYGFIFHLIVIAPIIAFISEDKFFKNYLIGITAVIFGAIANYAILMIHDEVRELQHRKEHPYYYSNYFSQDSTIYIKDDTDANALDFSNVNQQIIEGVYLSNLSITTLPNEIAEIDSLVELNLSSIQNLDVSNAILNLENQNNLRKLSLTDFGLEALPKELLLLKNLEKLDIGMNPKLNPDSVFNLLAELPNLQELRIQENRWNYLPSSISNLQHLKILDAKDNYLEQLPTELNNMKSLEKIVIKFNPVANNFDQFIDTTNVRVNNY